MTYDIPSDPANSTYPIRVEFFLADANGQGKTYLGFDTFTVDDYNAGHKASVVVTISPFSLYGKIVGTATDSIPAADDIGPANTSEFSPAAMIISP